MPKKPKVDPIGAGESGSISERWTVRILGTVSVEGQNVTHDQFPTRRSALILIRLALAQGRSVSRDALASELWPDEFADATKPRLRQELARLRRALADAGDILAGDRLMVRIDTSRADIDLQIAERTILRSEFQEDPVALSGPLSDIALELAPGYDEAWIIGPREDWRHRCSESLLKLSEKCVEIGREGDGAALSRRAALFHLVSESVQVRYIKLLLRIGRSDEASSHLADLNRVYPQLLGMGPSRRLVDLIAAQRAAIRPASVPAESVRAEIRPLPAALATLFGRGSETDLLKSRLDPKGPIRLSTLCGPGGIGKTHLAMEVARELYDAYRSRVWFVALSAVASPVRITHVLAESLGIPVVNRDPIDAVAEALSGSPSLLVLDNFEQLVDGGAQVVRSILERCPDVRLLVTTRRTLNLEGEHELPLNPLSTVAAVDLFLSLGRAHRQSFGRCDEDLEKIADIVQLLDRMPLAIHLAAARAGVLSLKDIQVQLVHRFDLLVSRRGDVVERHRTMRQTVAWSYDQLSDSLKRFFTDLAVFEGGWTTEVASDVLQEPKALELLEELRENSLVTVEPRGDEMRFNMLATLRDFADENQDEKRLVIHRKRLCNSLLALCDEAAKRMLAFEQGWWYERLETEHDNIRTALKWAASHDQATGVELCCHLWRYWSVCGHQVEARNWFELFLPENVEPTHNAARAMFGAARCAIEQGDTRLAALWYQRAREAYIANGDASGTAMVDYNRGGVLIAQGDYEGARDVFRAVQLDGHFTQTSYGQALCRDDLGLALMELGQMESSKTELDQARKLLEGHTDRIALAYCEINLGRHRLKSGRPDEAKSLLLTALDIHRQFGNHHGVGLAYENLASIALANGRLPEAELMLEESTQARNAIANTLGIARVLRIRSDIEAARGNRDRSAEFRAEAGRLFDQCGCLPLADECGAGFAAPPSKKGPRSQTRPMS